MININYRFKRLFLINLCHFLKLIQITDFFFRKKNLQSCDNNTQIGFHFFQSLLLQRNFHFSLIRKKDFNINDNYRLSPSSVSVSLYLLVVMIFL